MQTRIVAHRGASFEAPENTLEAFERAIQAGADMIEFDVRRAPDGQLVISHDPVPDAGPRLPTLEETVRLTRQRIQLDVELKEPGCEREALDLLRPDFPLSKFAITSFLFPVLSAVRALDAGVRTGFIFAEWNDEIRAACLRSEVDFLVPHHRCVAACTAIGKQLFVWTVDQPEHLRRFFAHPLVEAIITNDPRQAVAVRSR